MSDVLCKQPLLKGSGEHRFATIYWTGGSLLRTNYKHLYAAWKVKFAQVFPRVTSAWVHAAGWAEPSIRPSAPGLLPHQALSPVCLTSWSWASLSYQPSKDLRGSQENTQEVARPLWPVPSAPGVGPRKMWQPPPQFILLVCLLA